MTQKQSIAVIGAGIIGINCAIALQKKGYQVTVIDKSSPGEGCSKGNAGHFATEQVFPLAEFNLLWQFPKLLLSPLSPLTISPKYFLNALPWFLKFIKNMFNTRRTSNTKALRALNEKSLKSYSNLLAEANGEYLLVKNGSLLVFEHASYQDVVKIQKIYQTQNIAVEFLDKEALFKLEPNLNDGIQCALYFTDVAHTINPLSLSKFLAKYAVSLGVNIDKSVVNAINHFEQGVNVVTQSTTLCFDKLVVATGASSAHFAQQLGYNVPLEAERGYSLDFPNETINYLSRPVASADRKFIITPMEHGLRIAGSVEFAGLTAPLNKQRIEMLYHHTQHVVKQVPNRDNIVDRGWLGCRPSLPDSLPVICKAPHHENVTFAFGHQHLGLTQGAITGTLIAQIINKESPEINLSPYCISRFN